MAPTYDKTFVSPEVDAQPKRIVICCDGTWQSATSLDPTKGCSSNVARLSRVLANAGKDKNGKEWQQLVYYDAGIGTGDITDVEKKRQGGLGSGLIEKILEAYNFLANNFCAGDQLFFFGFSRGAYTVRATAGLVCQLGVLKPASMSTFISLYNEYVHGKDGAGKSFDRYPAWTEFTEASKATGGHAISLPAEIKIQVIGVWDTVGALGIPNLGHFSHFKLHRAHQKAYQFYDTTLNDRILHAYQALALDERRESFAPAMWKLKPTPLIDPKGDPNGPREKPKTALCQCWFPGAHINVGGGSSANAGKSPKGDREQLASVSYGWMLDRIRPHLALSEAALAGQIAEFKRMAEMEPEPETGWSIWNAPRFVKNLISDTTNKALPAGYGIGEIDDSHTPMYWLMAFPKEREPNFYDSVAPSKKVPVEEQWYTVERIHPSVHYRQQAQLDHGMQPYVPAALQGWERIEESHGMGRDGARKGWKWVKFNKKRERLDEMWEFEIGGFPEGMSVEKRLIDASLVKDIHEKASAAWKK
ncbi:uncharacterized protein L3040_007890 [Drepanopeziza brunnea f. sp. 'multigermtubi']|uniref:Putative peptidoglycan binding domain containing protein n=1 Tax=Marssonina brunnea f. sp. multigermtubi (strain MB_m1) TaxID=1072389 RepID=K1XNQ1_MARBU|nr:putative peptidoglycan binding domain containing protein [Drepanopeziza brunnea f. sp. 'multigermtubi' MB_m1]EKD14109.1 putative peptidoglycan binding domain containing protein [Drepanopeziza brunnea f. sp. 'multigermtubi' MB_m1]KAJ5035422.1 hypothetical protein L3040_007890 [Drepanopeziza brunnea f. sp. 'multigermtubi']